MLNFPSYPILLPIFAVFGFFVASIFIHLLIKEKETNQYEILRAVMGAVLGSVFFFVGTILSISFIWSTYNFRNINISEVKSIRAIKSEDEYKNHNSKSVLYENTESIQKALESLKNCSETKRNHESYQDGYRFQIIFADENSEKDFFISVYRKSNNKVGKSVVIPHYYENENLTLGEHDCPTFQDWVEENIDPLFQNK